MNAKEYEKIIAALRSQLATVTAERNELFNVAVKAFQAVEDMDTRAIRKESAANLDHALANDLNDDLWERINAAALKGGK